MECVVRLLVTRITVVPLAMGSVVLVLALTALLMHTPRSQVVMIPQTIEKLVGNTVVERTG